MAAVAAKAVATGECVPGVSTDADRPARVAVAATDVVPADPGTMSADADRPARVAVADTSVGTNSVVVILRKVIVRSCEMSTVSKKNVLTSSICADGGAKK